MDGIEQLICCSTEGEIRGYKAMPTNALDAASDRNVNQETIRDMTQRKQVKYIKFFPKNFIQIKQLFIHIIEFIVRIEQFRRSFKAIS